MNERTVFASARDREALAGLQPAVMTEAEVGRNNGLVQKPWGFEYEVSANAAEAVWKLHLNPGAETSMHAHPGKETVLIVAEGTVHFSTIDETFELGVGERVWIQRGAFHRTATAAGAVVIEIESPPDKRDLVRLSDKYGRQARGETLAA